MNTDGFIDFEVHYYNIVIVDLAEIRSAQRLVLAFPKVVSASTNPRRLRVS